MANDCTYRCRAISKNEDSLKEFISILQYKDPKKRWVPRVFSAEADKVTKDGEFFVMEFYGSVAWSIYSCWSDCQHSYYDEIMQAKESRDNGNERVPFADEVIKDAREGKVKSIPILCKELCIALEGWSEEEGLEFQEHFSCTHEGVFNLEISDLKHPWNEEKDDYDDEIGGFPNYGSWEDSNVVWNGGKS